MPSASLQGAAVALFEARRENEMARLVERYGGVPVCAPALKEVTAELTPELRAFASALERREFDIVLLLTGVGTRRLAAVLEPVVPHTRFADLLSQVILGARGPKTVAALKELGIRNYLLAPEPHTWVELLDALSKTTNLAGKHVAVQLYGAPHAQLREALEAAGARVTEVTIYGWSLPDDVRPLETCIDRLIAGDIPLGLVTSAPQLNSLFDVAERRGQRAQLHAALKHVHLGSIGPSCTARFHDFGLEPAFEPAHSKMGHLVQLAAQFWSSQQAIDST